MTSKTNITAQLRDLATQAKKRSSSPDGATDFGWVEQEVIPHLHPVFEDDRLQQAATWSLKLLVLQEPIEEYQVVESAVGNLLEEALAIIPNVAELQDMEPEPREAADPSTLPELYEKLHQHMQCCFKSNDELLVAPLREAVSAAKQPIVVADDFFRPLPAPCESPDELDKFQLVSERDFGYSQIVQWGDSLPRRFMVRLRNFVQSIVITQRMLKPGYSGAGKPSSDNITPVHEKCYKVFGSLYERLIQKPCTEGLEGVAVLGKLYMLFHPLSHPMLPCLEGPLQSKRTSLRRAWRKEATDCQFFACLARGLEKAAALLGGKSTEKGKSRRRKKLRGQKVKSKAVTILGAILAYHQFESKEENLTPARQTELGILAGEEDRPWAQYKVSRAMESLLGPKPVEQYKRILRKTNPLAGFIKKGKSPDAPNDVDAPYYRPQHPTEAEERRSKNT